MKKNLSFLIAFLCASIVLRAQTVTRSWDFNDPVANNKADGWDIAFYSNPNTSAGILNLTATSGAGYCSLTYNVPAGETIDPAVSKIFKIRVKNGTKDRRTNFIWTNEFGNSKMEVIMSTEDADFKEYTIDLTHDQRWKGTISKLLIQMPIPIGTASVGTIINVDYLQLTEALPASLLPAMVPKIPAPFGVNLSGGEFSFGRTESNWRYPRQQELDYLQAKGFKLIRLPFLWERIQPTLNGPLNEESLSHLKNLVWAARTRGMYVLLDLHNYNRRRVMNGPFLESNGGNPDITDYINGTPENPITNVVDVWTKLADEFKGFDNIYAYGIMNEPYGTPRDIPWVNTAQAIIDGIRTKDANHTIMIGGESYSSAQQWPNVSNNLRSLVDPSNDLMYEAHVYFDQNSSGDYTTYEAANASPQSGINRVRPFVEWLKKYNLRGFMGEYGVPNDDPRWNTLLSNTLQYLKENGVNGTYWSYGTSWGTYKLHVYPDGGVDRPQMAVLTNYLFADAPAATPGINSPLAVNYRTSEAVIYKPAATNSPTSFTITGLPSGLVYNAGTNEISGTIPAGEHTIAISATNASGTGEVREVTLRGISHAIPGIIEAEDYNTGGEGIGYHDTSIGNSGNNSYRDEDVDTRLENSVLSVTHTIAGEWLKYTVNAAQAASFNVKVRYATVTAGGKINLKVDGNLLVENIELPVTPSLTAWREVSFEIPVQQQGQHEFTFEVVSGAFDFDRSEFTVIQPPALAPANATATAFGGRKVNLSWGTVAGSTFYKLERAETENGTYSVIANNLTSTSYTDETVQPSTTYFYTIKGMNLAGEGPASVKVSATTTAISIPAQVSGFSVSSGDASVELNWTLLPDVVQYNVKRSSTAGGPYTVVGTPATNTYTDASVVNNSNYYYVISAENEEGEGANSAEKMATPNNVDYAYWRFDEPANTNITIASNSTFTVADAWGNKNGGFAIGTEIKPSSGDISFISGNNISKFTNAVRFRGNTNSFIKLPDGLMSGINDFTISLYYRHISGDYGRIFDFGVGDGYTTGASDATKKHMYLTAKGGSGTTKYITYAAQNGGELKLIETSASVTTGQFYHIVITQSGSTVTVYVNGVQVGQRTDVNFKPSDFGATTHNYLGRSRYGQKLDGVLDDMKIFGRALTQNEVIALGNGTLPVTFRDFTLKKQNTGSVVLNWSTASEKANSHFEILRSADGQSFNNITNVPGSNNSTDIKSYNYTDYAPVSGVNYYQLKQVDFNGESSAHPDVLAVNVSLDNAGDLKIYHSHQLLKLQANVTRAAAFTLTLSDLSGRVVASFKDVVSPGSNALEFPIGKLTPGIYIATYVNDTEKRSIKIVVD